MASDDLKQILLDGGVSEETADKLIAAADKEMSDYLAALRKKLVDNGRRRPSA